MMVALRALLGSGQAQRKMGNILGSFSLAASGNHKPRADSAPAVLRIATGLIRQRKLFPIYQDDGKRM